MEQRYTQDNRIVQRISLDDPTIEFETVQHHVERYKFATTIKTAGNNALDLGCGTGYGTNILHQSGYATTGVDIDADIIDSAKGKYPDPEFLNANITDVDYTGFSLITLFEITPKLEHLTGVGVITRVGKSIDKNGIFIMSTPKDARLGVNPYHKNELKFEDLKFLLKKTFKHVKLFGQSWESGKIYSDNPESGDFFIAVCSNTHIELLKS